MAYPTEFSDQISGRRFFFLITSQLLALAILLAGPALVRAVNSPVAPTEPSALQVILVDSATDTVLIGQRIDVYQQRSDGRLKWRARGTTNGDGQVSFDLSNRRLEPGLPLIFRARPFGSNAYSEPVKIGPGEFVFKVGQLMVKLVSGASGEPMPGEKVVLKQIDAKGRHWWVSRNTTDADGIARFDPKGLGEGSSFIARARSPISRRWKLSDPINEAGMHKFVVGNKPLLVNLVDALDGSAQPGVRVDAWHQPEGGKRRWLARTETDAEGVARFDIDNLGEPDGPVVSLRAKVFGGSAYTSGITATGPYTFPVGTLNLTLRSRVDGQLMPNAQVHLREVLDDGAHRWAMRGRTNADGVVRFTPAGLGEGREYRAKARSPSTRKWHSSEVYSAAGRYEFEVGNVPLVVSMVDGISAAPVTNKAIYAIEIFDNGARPKWRGKSVTDEDGVAVFDLSGLGEGRVYTLYARPFNAGSVRSAPIMEPGKFVFRVGTVPVTLIDGDSGEALAKRKLIAYRLGADDRKHWYRSAYTDLTGTVRFDLPGVGEGESYVIKAYNPFGDKQHFYSDPITQQGAVRFEVLADADRVPPQISVESPAQGMEVGTGNLTVRGTASDDEALAAVRLSVAGTAIDVALDSMTGVWEAIVPAELLVAGPLALVATAVDEAQNETSVTRNVMVVVDSTPPTVSITSHGAGATVPASGFSLSGVAADNAGLAAVLVSVSDPLLGATVTDASASINPATGEWSLQILSGQISVDETVNVSVRAVDEVGLTSTVAINLVVIPVAADVRHLVNRITFGPTFDLLQRANTIGAGAYLAEQLNWQAIDDSDLDALLADLSPVQSTTDLQTYQLLHAVHSRRQLREVMTVFWDNHFNTSVNARNSGQENTVAYELAENQAFRANALGRFRDLLEISAKSPAMLIYLDSISNVAGAPNENYPRELLELHTMKVDGGYTQQDVEEVARAFTGWQISNGAFNFEASLHDSGEKLVLGNVIPANGGVGDGEQVLDILSVHPSTASFICSKLTVALVSDTPPLSLVESCIATFLATSDQPDQIASVLDSILSSAQFHDPLHHGAKVKTPLEMIAGIARGLEAVGTLRDLPGFLRSMGMRMFENPVPTGFADTGDAWISAGQLVERYKAADRIVFNPAGGDRTSVEPLDLALSHGASTAAGVIALLLDLTVGDDYSVLERQVAMDVLTDFGETPYNPSDPQEADARLRAVLGTLMSFPAYQFQ